MADDPLSAIEDAPLFIVPQVLDALRAFRAAPKFAQLADAERDRLTVELDGLTDRLLAGIAGHPTKFWVMKQFQRSLEAVDKEDSAGRAHFGQALDQLMDIVGIRGVGG